jgi:hypothetical protein
MYTGCPKKMYTRYNTEYSPCLYTSFWDILYLKNLDIYLTECDYVSLSSYQLNVFVIIIIIINNFKAWANWSVPRHLSSQLVMFSPF